MLLRDYLDGARLDHRVQIFATDIDREAIDRARSGLYPETIAADLPAGMLERFFVHENGGYRVKKSLRDLVMFAVQKRDQGPAVLAARPDQLPQFDDLSWTPHCSNGC